MARPPVEPVNQHQVVIYEAKGGQKVNLSLSIVRDFLVTGKKELVTDQEIIFFMGICKARGLNPFAKDCYLVKFSTDPAAIITAIDFYRSRARAQKDCKGWSKGVICLQKDGTLRYSNGLVLDGETMVGGWFKGQPLGWDIPFELEVNLSGYFKDNAFWKGGKAATMIAKVAESQGLRTLWPDEFRGTITAEEIGELSEALTSGELLPEAAATPAKLEPIDMSKFDALVEPKMKELSPEEFQVRAQHLADYLEINVTAMLGRKPKTDENVHAITQKLLKMATDAFEPYAHQGEQKPGFWNMFLAWEANPDRPWNQKEKPVGGTYGECFAHGRFTGDECPVCAKEQKAPVAPGAEGGPSEKAETQAAANEEGQEAGEETFGVRVERLWKMVTEKSPPLKAMKDACGVTNLKTITPDNIDAFETFITEYEKK